MDHSKLAGLVAEPPGTDVLGAAEKAVWEEKAIADKVRYNTEMSAYKATAQAEAVAAAADDAAQICEVLD